MCVCTRRAHEMIQFDWSQNCAYEMSRVFPRSRAFATKRRHVRRHVLTPPPSSAHVGAVDVLTRAPTFVTEALFEEIPVDRIVRRYSDSASRSHCSSSVCDMSPLSCACGGKFLHPKANRRLSARQDTQNKENHDDGDGGNTRHVRRRRTRGRVFVDGLRSAWRRVAERRTGVIHTFGDGRFLFDSTFSAKNLD